FQNIIFPYLPVGDNSIDLVLGLSVFTHIHEYEEAWLLELHRILRKGGIAWCTIHSERTWKQITEDHFMYKHFASQPHVIECAGAIVDTPLADLFKHDMPEEKVVFSATDYPANNANVFHSTDYIRREWGRIFAVVKILHTTRGVERKGSRDSQVEKCA